VVAVLGTGTMAAGTVRSLRRADLPVRTWNRDPGKARALSDTGGEAFDSAAEAAAGADVVLTVLLDADAVLDVIGQASPAAGTVWLQTPTVGLEGADRRSRRPGSWTSSWSTVPCSARSSPPSRARRSCSRPARGRPARPAPGLVPGR
jgi:3-hydroxyisobutyrate dehydrogenase-like beta-hydroxyacid dehydrogenase